MPARVEMKAEFEAFVGRHLTTLLRIARSLTGDPDAADDLTQHSLEKAYRSWGKVTTTGDPLAYVRRILVNAAYDSWHRRRRFRELFGTQSEDREVAATNPWGDPERRVEGAARLDQLLRPLTDKERAVITLRFLLDLSEADAADELGVAVGTIKSTTARALKRMRQAETEQLIGVRHGSQ